MEMARKKIICPSSSLEMAVVQWKKHIIKELFYEQEKIPRPDSGHH